MPEDISAEELIFTIRKVGLHLTTQLELCFKEKEISGIQAYFLVYILRHHPKGTFLTELYHEIGVSKPTLSVLIKKLKQKGIFRWKKTRRIFGKRRWFLQQNFWKKEKLFCDRLVRWNPGFAVRWMPRKKSSCKAWHRKCWSKW